MMMNIIIHKETKEYINTYNRVSFIVIVIAIDFIIKDVWKIALLNIDLKFVIFFMFIRYIYVLTL